MQKILLLRFSSIGDIVLTSPVVRCLKTQLEAVEIHYLTKKSFASILEANPYIDKVYTFDKVEQPLKETVKELQEEQYDIIVDLHKNFRSWYVSKKLGVRTLTFKKLNPQKWLLTQFKINWMPEVHIVDRYLDTVLSLNVKNDGKGLDYTIPSADYINPSSIDTRLENKQYLVFVIGAAHTTKRLPPSKIKAICSLLKEELIVLIGGKGDVEAANFIKTAGAQVINACGQFNLHQSASIVDQARLVIAHDTGFMHIAAALKRPIVSIWGNTVPQFGMYPYLPADSSNFSIIEQPNLACRPCSKIGYSKCPKGHFNCMNQLEETAIVKTIQELFLV
ncbi:MAG: glycosyltransferase family 9 protein [Aureispira sp.]|nr:glycosyltransferase family 9 protein [Aureispira sp.]